MITPPWLSHHSRQRTLSTESLFDCRPKRLVQPLNKNATLHASTRSHGCILTFLLHQLPDVHSSRGQPICYAFFIILYTWYTVPGVFCHVATAFFCHVVAVRGDPTSDRSGDGSPQGRLHGNPFHRRHRKRESNNLLVSWANDKCDVQVSGRDSCAPFILYSYVSYIDLSHCASVLYGDAIIAQFLRVLKPTSNVSLIVARWICGPEQRLTKPLLS